MLYRKSFGTLVLGLFLAGRVCAGNDALAQLQSVPTGERVANYLQSMMISVCAILEAKKPGDMLNRAEMYRVAVTYDPQEKVIELSVVGDPYRPQERPREA